jgi:chromosome segregation ATPase
MYDVVKNERNGYVNSIQAANQALAEMKERIKILHNEVDILQNESLAKDRALGKERLAHQTAQLQRDALRLEANKSHSSYRTAQEKVEQQIVEIDKLNSIINGLESDMLVLKKRYEVAVEARNYTGIQLIDRNDELCILYEKSNINEETLRRGEVSLRAKEEEIRMLRIQIAEVERQIGATRAQLPKLPQKAARIVSLTKELAAEQEVTEKLCVDLETPGNGERWRPLGGEDPDTEQLAAKVKVLEDRLGEKREAVLEKELVLEEVTALSERLRQQAASDRGATLDVSRDVSKLQARIRDTTRKMMATVSELSMYQATALKLEEEVTSREEELHVAEERLEAGHAPTDDMEQEWYRIQRDAAARQEAATLRAAMGAADASIIPGTATRTTAEPRPNVYIFDDIGILKPYGGWALFKPSMPGVSMRHFRPPQTKDIEI